MRRQRRVVRAGKVPEGKLVSIGSTNSSTARGMIAAVAMALAAVAVAWSVPRSLGDLWIGLAAGRDILAGRLGAPDDWAFTTAGRVWINQNWGSHLLSWLAWSAGGEAGLLLLKALLVGAVLGLSAWVGRMRGARWSFALLAASGMLLAGHSYIDLRPNLFTLVMAPLTLGLIYRSAAPVSTAPGGNAGASGSVWRLGLAVVAVVAWANLHGGFLLGLLMLWFWAAAHLLAPASAGAAVKASGRTGAIAAALATLLCGVITPFGFANLTETFRIVSATGWHEVREWQPIWVPGTYDNPWGFAVAVAAMVVLLVLQRGGPPRPAGRGRPAPAPADAAVRAFELALTLITLVLALRARRFAPVALVLLAPPFASALERAAARLGPRVGTAVLALQLAGLALLIPPILHTYDPANPRLRRGDTLFARMHSLNSDFPVSTTRFLVANRIGMDDPAGLRALVAWEWEGYARLTAPQLKVMLGGRAQQIYTPSDLAAWRTTLGPGIATETRARGISLALLHAAPEAYRDQVAALLGAGWVALFMDSPTMLLVDGRNPSMRALLDRAEAGRLSYPDERMRLAGEAWVKLGALSEGRGTPAGVIAAAAAALEAAPDPTWCGLIASLAGASPELGAEGVRLLEAQLRRLESLDPAAAPGGERALMARRAAREALATLYERGGRPELAATSRAAAEFDARQLEQLARRWRM